MEGVSQPHPKYTSVGQVLLQLLHCWLHNFSVSVSNELRIAYMLCLLMMYRATYGCMLLFVIFSLWWYLDASVLTTAAVMLFFITFADFAIPTIGNRLLFGKEWLVFKI